MIEAAPWKPANRLLLIAAAAGAELAVRIHIARGDNLEGRDKRGYTPLMIAASRGKTGVCRLLLQAGVDASAKDSSGRDSVELARDFGSAELAELIAQNLASKKTDPASQYPDLSESSIQTEPVEEPALVAHETEPQSTLRPPEPALVFDGVTATGRDEAQAGAEHAVALLMPLKGVPDAPSVIAPELAMLTLEASPSEPEEQESPFESMFGDWEPAPLAFAPPDIPSLAAAELIKQRQISEHAPIDHSAEWSEFAAELPEFAKPLPRADDEDFRAALRRIVLLAAREGSVPRIALEDLLSERGDSAARDPIAEAQLLVVIGEMGAEIDERQELPVGSESFEIFVDPNESTVEQDEVDDALTFFEELQSGRNEPLRIYLRSAANKALLNAEQEATLAKAMEAAIARALDALALWPAGLRRVLAATVGAQVSPTLLAPILALSREDEESDGESSESGGGGTQTSQSEETYLKKDQEDNAKPGNVSGPTGSLEAALAALHQIRELLESSPTASAHSTQIREHLRALSFRRPYLARLADYEPSDKCSGAASYRMAISELLVNRDAMARANLRLVYASAKRYLYSGLPLDDLIQEGNIGLIKAVDRFDWRRGYKFSTMATWWIKQQIGRSIPDSAFDIRPPVHVYEKASKLRQAVEAFERTNADVPTTAKRAALLGMSIPKMEMITRPSSPPLSIDEALASGAWDVEGPQDPFEVLAAKELARVVADRLASLNRKSQAIIRMRTGIGLQDAMTLEQVGVAMDVTRERIRQIESQTLRTLSSLPSREQLAIALGWPLPERRRTQTNASEAAEPENEVEVEATCGGAHAGLGVPSAAIRQAIIDAATANSATQSPSLPGAILSIIDSALARGLEVKIGAKGSGPVVLIQDIAPENEADHEFVRDMLQLGFVREPGTGYKK